MNLNSLATTKLEELDSDMTQPQFGSFNSELVRSGLFHDDYDEASDSNVLSSGVLDKMELITADAYKYFAVLAVALLECWVVAVSMNLKLHSFSMWQMIRCRPKILRLFLRTSLMKVWHQLRLTN